MTEPGQSCAEPSKGPLRMPDAVSSEPQGTREELKTMAKVGKPAPDFEASAYVEDGFKDIRLSAYKGKWVILCFYPGDFTFV